MGVNVCPHSVRLILKKPIISDRSLEKRLLAKYG